MKCTVSALWRQYCRVPCYYLKPFSNHRQLRKDLSGRERWGLGGHFITSQQRVCFASLQAVWRCEGEDRCYTQTWRRKDLSASADWFTTPGWKPAPQRVPLSGMLRHCLSFVVGGQSRPFKSAGRNVNVFLFSAQSFLRTGTQGFSCRISLRTHWRCPQEPLPSRSSSSRCVQSNQASWDTGAQTEKICHVVLWTEQKENESWTWWEWCHSLLQSPQIMFVLQQLLVK